MTDPDEKQQFVTTNPEDGERDKLNTSHEVKSQETVGQNGIEPEQFIDTADPNKPTTNGKGRNGLKPDDSFDYIDGASDRDGEEDDHRMGHDKYDENTDHEHVKSEWTPCT